MWCDYTYAEPTVPAQTITNQVDGKVATKQVIVGMR